MHVCKDTLGSLRLTPLSVLTLPDRQFRTSPTARSWRAARAKRRLKSLREKRNCTAKSNPFLLVTVAAHPGSLNCSSCPRCCMSWRWTSMSSRTAPTPVRIQSNRHWPRRTKVEVWTGETLPCTLVPIRRAQGKQPSTVWCKILWTNLRLFPTEPCTKKMLLFKRAPNLTMTTRRTNAKE
jgi:hypothetical protein